LSQLVYLVLVWKFSQKYFYIPYELTKILKIFITGIILSVIAAFANRLPLVPAILIKFILIAVFPVILYFWNFFEKIELERLKEFWLKWKNPGKWINNIKSLKKDPDQEITA
jgi:cytochrome c oxidase subunit IV